MKKYKLIKEYPGSPKLGSIADRKDDAGFWYVGNGYFNVGKNLEKYPGVWEEIVEKEYEILSFSNAKNLIWNKAKDGRFDAKWQMYRPTEGDALKEPGIKIYSVKRLSDGEVFTIGDRIDSSVSDLGRPTELTGFKFINNKLYVGLRHLGYNPLSSIIPKKKILFTTKDGVDIYEGDRYYVPQSEKSLVTNSWVCEFRAIDNESIIHRSERFSTEEAALDYIIENKPCLSLKDLRNSCISEALYKDPSIINKMKDLVKSKL